MSFLDNIKYVIVEELKSFNRIFIDSLSSDNEILKGVNQYVLEGSGKMLRPILTILSAKACGKVSDTTYNAALALELLHNASLIHDDVVDDTLERRGRKSINARWSNKIAVLSGDYMLSKSLVFATQTNDLDILKAISQIGMELSDGELLQLLHTQKATITEEEYFTVIRKKTALLFSTCMQVGALSVHANQEQEESLVRFGEYLGICFQIKDDIFDYHQNIEIGKPTSNDLQDGKITLPLIYVLNNTSGDAHQKCRQILSSKDFTEENVEFIMDYTRINGGLEYAEACMLKYKQKAIEALQVFEDSEVKKALIESAEFAASRMK